MLEQLDAGPLSVSQLAEPFDVTLTAITQHVRTLERAGLIRSTKSGRQRLCAADRETMAQAEAWIARRRRSWEQRLDRIERHLDAHSATTDPKGSPQ